MRNDPEPEVQVETLRPHRAFRSEADMHTRCRRVPGVVLKGQGDMFAHAVGHGRERICSIPVTVHAGQPLVGQCRFNQVAALCMR